MGDIIQSAHYTQHHVHNSNIIAVEFKLITFTFEQTEIIQVLKSNNPIIWKQEMKQIQLLGSLLHIIFCSSFAIYEIYHHSPSPTFHLTSPNAWHPSPSPWQHVAPPP